jgi:hypothetical protein
MTGGGHGAQAPIIREVGAKDKTTSKTFKFH